jgi:phospholipid/cholesterol/gamma-HCH transport system substrate-binding protein
MTTLDSSKDALFDTVRNLQLFSGALAQHDAETRSFMTNLATVTGQLDGERASFTAAVHEVGVALEQVTTFVKSNRELLATDVAELARVTTILAKERVLLAHIADIGAVGVGNYPHMYTPSARTYNARFDNNDRQDNPALFVCQLYESVGGSPQQCLDYLSPLNSLPIPPKAAR